MLKDKVLLICHRLYQTQTFVPGNLNSLVNDLIHSVPVYYKYVALFHSGVSVYCCGTLYKKNPSCSSFLNSASRYYLLYTEFLKLAFSIHQTKNEFFKTYFATVSRYRGKRQTSWPGRRRNFGPNFYFRSWKLTLDRLI